MAEVDVKIGSSDPLCRDWFALAIEGREACGFIHDLMTLDAMALPRKSAEAAALLSPQGKIIVLGLLCCLDSERYRYCVPRIIAEKCLTLLKFYRLRRKVKLSIDYSLKVGIGADKLGTMSFQDKRSDELGYVSLLPFNAKLSNKRFSSLYDHDAYHHIRRKAGVFDLGDDFESNDLLPHDIGLDAWGALSADKGCYLGQEVVTRMIHRGQINRRPMLMKPIEGALPEKSGDIIASGGTLLGVCYDASPSSLRLAVIKLERLADIMRRGETPMLGKAQVKLDVPPYSGTISAYSQLG